MSAEEPMSLSLPFIPSYSQDRGQTLRPYSTLPRRASPGLRSDPAAAQELWPSPALLSASLQESVDLGEIMFSLCYLPTAGRLTLTVIKCRNLKAMDITGYSGTSPPQGLAMWPPHSPDFRMWRDVEKEGGGIAGIL